MLCIQLVAVLLAQWCSSLVTEAWTTTPLNPMVTTRLLFAKDVNDLDWDLDDKDDKEGTPKLGIDLGSMLEPLSEQEAAELKAAATEVINDAIAEGIDEIDKVRERMKREFERKRQSMAVKSDRNAQLESQKLLNKIDALTDAFLAKTEPIRSSTKLAAAADQAMEGRGVDVGSWGSLGGAVVASTGQASLLGSVQDAQSKQNGSTEKDEETVLEQSNRILILADTGQDAYAKKLVPVLTENLQKVLPPGLQVDVYKPTATLPIGGDNGACVVLFCTSFSEKSTVYSAMDRLLRKTLQPGGSVGQPPTQLVGISTLGTERTGKTPYNLQNLMGGKLDKRRQIEEAVINTVKQRVVEPSLDYTICKLGELKDSVSEPFGFAPGDVLDGNTALDTAVTVLVQAIAYQPSARNVTLCCVGQLSGAMSQDERADLLDDSFLKLEGPELWRTVLTASSETAQTNFEPLVEYVREWAELLAESGKGLTTPVRAEIAPVSGRIPGVTQAAGVKLLFLPTATGKNYLSREEEKTREKESGSSASTSPPRTKKNLSEGGIEILVEKTKTGSLRVRARRCNYADDAVIKELSEETILSRLNESIDVWLKDHQKS